MSGKLFVRDFYWEFVKTQLKQTQKKSEKNKTKTKKSEKKIFEINTKSQKINWNKNKCISWKQ